MATVTYTEETLGDAGVDRIDFISRLPTLPEELHHSGKDINHEINSRPAPESLFEEDQPEPAYPTGAQLWLSILTLCGVLILGALDINIVATAVPHITNEFHTVADVGWYSSAFRLTTCSFQFVFGKLYKFFPMKPVFLASNAIFLLSSVLCASAQSSTMFVVGRAVSGLGFAGILSGCNACSIFPPHRRPAFIGLICGVESVAIAASPVIGGALIQARGWRWCFWINLPIAGATLLMTYFFLPDLKNSEQDNRLPLKEKIHQMDLASNVLFLPAMACLFVALSWGGVKYSWSNGRVIGLFVTFVVLLAAFLWNQHRRGDAAALPLRIMKHRSIVAGFVFATCVNSVLNVLSYFLPTYYQIVRQYKPARSGYMVIPIVAGDSIGALVHGFGTSIWGYYAPWMVLASVLMPVFSGLISTFGPATSLAKLIIYSAGAGLGTGIGYMGPQNAVRTVLKTEDAPLGLSVVIFGANFGPAVFIPIAQVIFTNQLSSVLAQTGSGSDATSIENRGFGEIVDSVPPAQRAALLAGISRCLSHTWYLAVALGSITMVGSLLMEWKSVKQKKA